MICGKPASSGQGAPMATFGENLRREREMRGVTLEEISAATKITVRSLQALEADDFSKLPGGIFTRGFIRSYLKYLGLDEDALMAEYQSIEPKIPEPDLSTLGAGKIVHASHGSRSGMVGLLLAVLLLVGGIALYRRAHQIGNERSAAPTGQTAAEAGSAAQLPAAASNAAPEQSAASSRDRNKAASAPEAAAIPETGEIQAAALPAAEPPAQPASDSGNVLGNGDLTLQVAATEPSWVNIEADGRLLLSRVLNPNEIHTLRAKDSFDVTTGNAQGVILTLNGETMKPLGREGEVKKLHITHDDLKDQAQ